MEVHKPTHGTSGETVIYSVNMVLLQSDMRRLLHPVNIKLTFDCETEASFSAAGTTRVVC